MCKKYEFLSSFILLIVLGMFVSSCGDSGGSSINSTSSQTLDTWTDESTDATVPVTDLRMVKIATTATNSASPLTSTIAVVNGTLTTVSDIKVWWNTVDDFTTATQVGIKTSPDVGGAYKISLTGAGSGSGFLYYTISIPDGTTGNYYMRVLSIEGAGPDNIPLAKSTDTRNVLGHVAGEGELNWSFKAGGAIVSSPAIGNDGVIYVGSDDRHLYAINPDGTLKWKYETGDVITASPAIGSDGTIYVGSYDRQVYAINPDGSLRWAYPTVSILSTSPAIGSDGTIYVGGTDLDRYIFKCPSTCDYSPVPEDCIEAWSFEARLSTLYAINPDGTLKWSIKLKGTMGDAAENYFPASSPAIANDGTIYIGTHVGDPIHLERLIPCNPKTEIIPSSVDRNHPTNGHLYAIYPADGKIKWDFRTLGGVDSSPAIGSDGTIYVGSDGIHLGYGTDRTGVISLNPQTQGFVYAIYPYGKLKWLFDALGDVDCSPAIGTDGTIYVGSDNNHVYALNPADGKIKTIVNPDGSIIRQWIFPTRGNVNSSPALGSDGTIYVGSNSKFDDDLYAINPDGTEKWRFDTENFVNSSPTIGPDGTIYVGSNDGYLYAIKGKGTLAVSPWPKFHHDLRNTGRK
jgi:outer membrane protein assembly factor BamB